MIKTIISGDTTQTTRELMRILVHHPDIQFIEIDLGIGTGTRIDSVFPELTGDTDLVTSTLTGVAGCDVLFLTARSQKAAELVAGIENEEDRPKVIDLTGKYIENYNGDEPAIRGVCELWRKSLVRDAKTGVVPPAAETAVTIALLPFAKSLILNSDITVTLEGIHGSSDFAELARNIAYHLSVLQTSFKSRIDIKRGADSHDRGLVATVTFDSLISLDDMIKAFDDFYDDHNFVYRLGHKPTVGHILNTNKCFAHIDKNNGVATITVVLDNTIKGGAGNAVHIMNLMFKLHERTGLDLKNSN